MSTLSTSIVSQIFRMSMDDFIRRLKRTDNFRHPLFCAAELHDPLEPDDPFTGQGPLPSLEKDWHFRRDSVPEYIKIWVGRSGREKVLDGIRANFDLPPAERFRRLERDVKIELYNSQDPETWDTGFFSVVELPKGYITHPFGPTYWCGNRSAALTDPRVRPVFLDPRTKILHGQEAIAFAIQEMGIRKGERL